MIIEIYRRDSRLRGRLGDLKSNLVALHEFVQGLMTDSSRCVREIREKREERRPGRGNNLGFKSCLWVKNGRWNVRCWIV